MRRRVPGRTIQIVFVATCLGGTGGDGLTAQPTPQTLRAATFNTALSRDHPGAALADLQHRSGPQAGAVAALINSVAPDVLLINELDHDPDADTLTALRARLTDIHGAPLYPFAFTAPVNTGTPSGFDLDGDGSADGPADAWGYGRHPGHYGMAVLSRFPIDTDAVRTFRTLRWRDRPGHRMPAGFYPPDAEARHPLSSKSHWDVPIRVGGRTVHLLASHPTPPVFDGPEDRNGRRNADEIGFWTDYLSAGPGLTPGPGDNQAAWIVDDAGRTGGLAAGALFVVAGDLNNDPDEGGGDRAAITALLTHPRLTDPRPASAGALAAGLDADDTAAWGKRVDYVLPSRGLRVIDAGVFWPAPGEPLADEAAAASDHRLVWVDVAWPVGHENEK